MTSRAMFRFSGCKGHSRVSRSTVSVFLALAAACGGSERGTGPLPPPPPPTPDISPRVAVVVPGGTIRLEARAVGSVGNFLPVTFSWSTSDPSVAEIDAEGRVTGNAVGQVAVTAVSVNLRATATVEVVEENFVQVVAGGGFTCGLLAGGKAVCWGDNYAGYLGAGYKGDGIRLESRLPPVPVAGGLSFATLGTGPDEHTCGTTTARVAYCWGLDEATALGAPTSEVCENPTSGSEFGCSTVPLRVNTQVLFDWVSAFWDHSCGLTSAGEAYGWGDNRVGVLGVSGGSRDIPIPTPVETSLTFLALAGGAHNTCGVATDGTAYCWGLAGLAIKGPGEQDGFEPVAITGAPPLESITGGQWHMCGLVTDGRAYCWGINHEAQLGAASQDTCTVNTFDVDCSFTPLEVMGGHRFTQLSAGLWYTCGLTAAGAAYCWGDTDRGALGVDPAVGSSVMDPVLVPGGHSFVVIEAGYRHTCGITGEGGVYCWGANPSQQLGAETSGRWSAEPVRVFGPR